MAGRDIRIYNSNIFLLNPMVTKFFFLIKPDLSYVQIQQGNISLL